MLNPRPKKTEYMEYEPYDLKGVIVSALYDNGEKEPLSDYEVDKTIAALGDTALVFAYGEFSVSCDVTVKHLSIQKLEWETMPTKKEYFIGDEEFSCNGGRLKVTKLDKTVQLVDLIPHMVSGFDPNVVGTSKVAISYADKTLEFSFSVKERELLGITISALPEKTEYTAGEIFEPNGMRVDASYSGGLVKEDVDVLFWPGEPLTTATENIIVKYEGKAALLPITVNPAPESPSVPEEDEPPVEEPEPENTQEPENALEAEEDPTPEQEESQPCDTGIPVFYPSTFGLRFDEDPAEIKEQVERV